MIPSEYPGSPSRGLWWLAWPRMVKVPNHFGSSFGVPVCLILMFLELRRTSSRSKSKSLRWKSPACIKERLSTSAHTSQSPTKNEKKEKQQRLMRIRRVVIHVIQPAPSPPEASRSTSNSPFRSPIITVVVQVYFVSCFYCMAVQFSS